MNAIQTEEQSEKPITRQYTHAETEEQSEKQVHVGTYFLIESGL